MDSKKEFDMNEKIVKLGSLVQEIVNLGSDMDEKHMQMVEELCSSLIAVFANHDHIPMHETEINEEVSNVRVVSENGVVKVIKE